VGSRLTRPQARAATPLQLRETATIPIESGPGYSLQIAINKNTTTLTNIYELYKHKKEKKPSIKDY